MHDGTVEKSPIGQAEVGDRVPVLEAFDICPVFFRRGRSQIGSCGFTCFLMNVHGCIKCHLTLEHLREGLVGVELLAVDDGAIRQGDADRWRLHTGFWVVSQRGAKVEQLRPLPRVLGRCNFSIGGVDERVGAISQNAAFGDLGSIQLFSHHGLDWVPPERNDRTKNALRRAHRGALLLPLSSSERPCVPTPLAGDCNSNSTSAKPKGLRFSITRLSSVRPSMTPEPDQSQFVGSPPLPESRAIWKLSSNVWAGCQLPYRRPSTLN